MRPGSAFRSAVLCSLLFLLLIGAAPGPAPMSSHEKAAREVVQLLLSGGDVTTSAIDTTMSMVLQEPDMAPYEKQVREWYRKVLAESNFEEEMVKIYMDTFSEQELLELTAFYKTPTGRKMIAATPEIMKRGVAIGRRQAEAHSAELSGMLEKARREYESQPAATDKEAQKRTIAQIRNTGTAMFSCLTDQVGAAAAGQSQTEKQTPPTDIKRYPPISHEELVKILVPMYIQDVPKTDGWGHTYEYYLNTKDPLAQQVMTIRSPGRDGKFSTNNYTVTSFDPTDYDQDIVWSDGFFTRWPQAKQP
jgi:hypothetical protein